MPNDPRAHVPSPETGDADGGPEPELRAHAAVLDATLREASDGHALLDDTGRIRWLNPMMAERLGYTAAEVLGHHVSYINPRFPRDRYEALVARARQVRVPPFETLHRRCDGTEFPVEVSVAAVVLDGVPHLFSTTRDLRPRRAADDERERLLVQAQSARARAEALQGLTAALAQATTTTAVVLAAIREGRPAVGGSGGVMALLDEAQATFTLVAGPGISPEVAESWATFPNSGNNPATRAVASGEPCYSRTRAEYACGDPRIAAAAAQLGIAAAATLPLVVGGKTLGAMSFLFDAPRDFAEEDDALLRGMAGLCAQALERARLHEAEEAARAAAEAERQRLALILDQLPVGVVVVDERGAIVHFNPTLERLLGHPMIATHDTAGYAEYGGVHEDGRPYQPEDYPIARVLLHGESVDQEPTRYRRGDGRETTLAISAAPVYDASGVLRYAVATLQDVAEQRELEERLRQAQKMEVVGQLAGGIAHDFNNLLTAIAGNLEFLREEVAPDHPAHAEIDEIAHAADRAAALVRQLLLFSRRQALRLRPLRVGDAVTHAEKLLRRVIGEEIALETRIADAGAFVRADAGQLEQVLMNLAVNARDAMLTPLHGTAGRGGTLTVCVEVCELDEAAAAARRVPRAGAWVLLRVSDTGHGMDDATRAHVFEPFFTTKDVGAGTGLGLATVFGIVQQLGGAIDIESRPGRGTTFTIFLPAVRDEGGDGDASARATVPSPGAVRTLLLVEDERPVRVMMRRLLERRGYAVLESQDGAEALLLWRRHRGVIDVLVTDVRMPVMGGLELAANVQADYPGFPTIFVSGYSADSALLANGTHEMFVEKPFTADALVEAVESLLRRLERSASRA